MRENRRRAAKIDIPESPNPEKTPWFWLISQQSITAITNGGMR